VWTDQCHWHEYVYYPKCAKPFLVDGVLQKIKKDEALNEPVNWLSFWDFNEEDSVFFIYADHSHRVKSYLDPPAYLTWAYFKDNRTQKQTINPMISSCDFYHLAAHILNLSDIPYNMYSTYAKNPFTPYDLQRIYGCEDGRAQAGIKISALSFLRGTLFVQENKGEIQVRTNDEKTGNEQNESNDEKTGDAQNEPNDEKTGNEQNEPNDEKTTNEPDDSKLLWISIAQINDNQLIRPGIYITLCELQNKHTYSAYCLESIEHLKEMKFFHTFSVRASSSLDEEKNEDRMIFSLDEAMMGKLEEMYWDAHAHSEHKS